MKRAAKSLFYGGLRACGATSLFSLANRGRVPILFYHGVTDRRPRGVINREDNHIPSEDFEAHLRFLKAERRVIPLAQYVRCLAEGRPAPERAAVITFDDGFENNYTTAFPLLKKYGLPATIYVTTDFVERGIPLWVDRLACAFESSPVVPQAERLPRFLEVKRRLKAMPQSERLDALEKTIGEVCDGREPALDPVYAPLKKEHIREMAASGLVEIGSHSLTHPILTSLSPEEKRREIEQSKAAAERLSGGSVESFAYPNGDYDAECLALVGRAGYASAAAAGMKLSDLRDSRFALSRLALGPGEGVAVAAATVSGLRRWIVALRS